MGLLLRACGNNPQFVVNLGKDPGTVKILGLMIGNGCAALAGCVLAQISENVDINTDKRDGRHGAGGGHNRDEPF